MTPVDAGAIPRVSPNVLEWLDCNWPFAGAVVAVVLGCLLPLLVGVWPTGLVLTYLLLLAYLIHQLEEHLGDRFRRFLNTYLGGGAEVLTPRATMLINVGEVWVLSLAVILLAGLVDVGFGLIVAYTTLLNALTHVVVAVVQRRYNPGLWTALVCFIPLGVWALLAIGHASGLGWAGHAIGVAVAVLGHAVILMVVLRRLRATHSLRGMRQHARNRPR